MDRNIRAILCMMEDISLPGSAMSGGGSMAQSGQIGQDVAMGMMPGDGMIGITAEVEDDSIKPEELAAAKQFVQLVGSAERARELIDKIDEILDVLDDGAGCCDDGDTKVIDMMAALIPDEVGFPTGVGNITRRNSNNTHQDLMRSIASQMDPSHRSM